MTDQGVKTVACKLGGKLKMLRKQENLTTQELAEKLSLSQPYISQLEKNGRIPSPKNIKKIADFFKVPYGYLMSDDAITIDEFKAAEALRTGQDKERYVPYYIVVDRAIDNDITPEELNDAINFVRKYKNKTPSN